MFLFIVYFLQSNIIINFLFSCVLFGFIIGLILAALFSISQIAAATRSTVSSSDVEKKEIIIELRAKLTERRLEGGEVKLVTRLLMNDEIEPPPDKDDDLTAFHEWADIWGSPMFFSKRHERAVVSSKATYMQK